MVKRVFVPFGESPVDKLVMAFLKKRNIDPNDISGYALTRSVEDIGTITFSMLFEDVPEEEQPPLIALTNPTGGATVPVLVGESGPELLCKCMNIDGQCPNQHYVPEDEESD